MEMPSISVHQDERTPPKTDRFRTGAGVVGFTKMTSPPLVPVFWQTRPCALLGEVQSLRSVSDLHTHDAGAGDRYVDRWMTEGEVGRRSGSSLCLSSVLAGIRVRSSRIGSRYRTAEIGEVGKRSRIPFVAQDRA